MCLPYFWLPCLCISTIFSTLKYWASRLEKSNFSSKMYSCIFFRLVPFYNIWRQIQQDNIVLPTLAPCEAFVLHTDRLLLCLYYFSKFCFYFTPTVLSRAQTLTIFIDASVWRLTLLLLAPVYNMWRQGQPLCLVLSYHLFHLKQPSRFTWMSWGSAGC